MTGLVSGLHYRLQIEWTVRRKPVSQNSGRALTGSANIVEAEES